MKFSTFNKQFVVSATVAGFALTSMGAAADPSQASERAAEASRPSLEDLSESELREVTAKGFSSHLVEVMNELKSGNLLALLKGLPKRFVPKTRGQSRIAGLQELVKNRQFEVLVWSEFTNGNSVLGLKNLGRLVLDGESLFSGTKFLLKSVNTLITASNKGSN